MVDHNNKFCCTSDLFVAKQHYACFKSGIHLGFQSSNYKQSRQPYTSPDGARLLWLECDFLQYLKTWKENVKNRVLPSNDNINKKKMLLSENTEEGLIISSLSMVAIVREILQEGAAYVLGRRVNQDPLEAYFGQQRSKGFRNENPTLQLFGSNARILDVAKRSTDGSNVVLD